MSNEALNWAVKIPGLSMAEKVVLLVLANRVRDHSHECDWMTLEMIGDEASVSRPTLMRSLSSLSSAGLIYRGSESGKRTTYRLNVGVEPVSHRDPYHSETGITQIPNPSHCDTLPVSHRDPSPYITQLNPINPCDIACARPEPETLELIPDLPVAKKTDGDFERFYAEYPKNEAVADARKAWGQVTKAFTPEKIMAGLQAAKAYWEATGREKQFIPLPATFLRKQHFLNQYDMAEAKNQNRMTKNERDQLASQNRLRAADEAIAEIHIRNGVEVPEAVARRLRRTSGGDEPGDGPGCIIDIDGCAVSGW